MYVEKFLREHAVIELRGLSRSMLWAQVKAGTFPSPVRISARAVAWPQSEVARIQAAIVAGKSLDELRGLVSEIEAARQEVA
jgi:prophage regulatory protein